MALLAMLYFCYMSLEYVKVLFPTLVLIWGRGAPKQYSMVDLEAASSDISLGCGDLLVLCLNIACCCLGTVVLRIVRETLMIFRVQQSSVLGLYGVRNRTRPLHGKSHTLALFASAFELDDMGQAPFCKLIRILSLQAKETVLEVQ